MSGGRGRFPHRSQRGREECKQPSQDDHSAHAEISTNTVRWRRGASGTPRREIAFLYPVACSPS